MVLNEFNNTHRCVIALPRECSQNPGIATVTIAIAIGDLIEEGMHELLVIDVSKGLPSGVQRAILGEGDHMIGGLAHGLRPRVGGLDAAVADELRGKGAQQGLALVGRLVELRHALPVADGLDRR